MKESYIQKFLEHSRYCKNLDELSMLLQNIFSEMGFSRWAYQTKSETILKDSEPILMHNYSAEWEKYYIENKCHEVDPVITIGSSLFTPFQWSKLTKNTEFTKEQITFNNIASEHGMNDGLAVPIPTINNGNVSVVSMATQENEKTLNQLLKFNYNQLISISCAFHAIAKDILSKTPTLTTTEKPLLTNRERECILWTARGKTSWEISVILSITERTVVFHIENSKKKLGTSSRHYAVVKAIIEGHITP